MNYRNLARKHLELANSELGTNSEQRLKYAALELRMAMEALTYDRALAYKDEFPPSEYQTWQPRRVMLVLLEIDPMADRDCTLSVGIEEEYGVPAPKMDLLGSEKVLGMALLKKHYDALGSYLHMQSMKKTRDGSVQDFKKMRVRCEKIAAFVGQVLLSRVFNITLGSFASLKCQECGSPIRKRIPGGQREVVAECHQCKAAYTIIDEGGGEVTWTPHQEEIECANTNCHQKIVIWYHDREVGRQLRCRACNGKNTFVLALNYEETQNIAPQEEPQSGTSKA